MSNNNLNNAGCVQAANNAIQAPWFQNLPAALGCGYLSGNPPLQYQGTSTITSQQANSFVECVCMSGNGQVQAIAYGNSINQMSYIDIFMRNNNSAQNKTNWMKTQIINFNSTNANTTGNCKISVNMQDACPAPNGSVINNSNNPANQNQLLTCGEGVVAGMSMDYCGAVLSVCAPTLGIGGAGFIFQLAQQCYQQTMQIENQTPNADQSVQSTAVSGDGLTVAFGIINCGAATTNCQNPGGCVMILKQFNCNCWILEQAWNLDNANVVQNIGCNPLIPNNEAFVKQNGLNNILGTPLPNQGTNNSGLLNVWNGMFGVNGINGKNNNAAIGSVCIPGQTLLAQCMALDALGQTLVLGANNCTLVLQNSNTIGCLPCDDQNPISNCLPACTIINTNKLNFCGNEIGPFTLQSVLIGSVPGAANANNINQYNQGIAVGVSANGNTVVVGSNLGSNACPIVPATVWVFDRKGNGGNNPVMNGPATFRQTARFTGSKAKQRVGGPCPSMGLFVSSDANYIVHSDANWTRAGNTADGAVWSHMRTALGGWVEQTRLESCVPNAQFGTTLTVPAAIDMLSVTAPNTCNSNGAGQTFVYT